MGAAPPFVKPCKHFAVVDEDARLAMIEVHVYKEQRVECDAQIT